MAPTLCTAGSTALIGPHWNAKPVTAGEAPGVEFSYRSPDGDEGYPGNLDVKVAYTWPDDNALTIDYTATTDKPTVLNLTNHAYWNLAGAPTVLDDILTVNADDTCRPTRRRFPLGELAAGQGTVMDFTTPHAIGERIDELNKPPHTTKGYDHCYVLRGPAGKLDLGSPGRGSAQRTDDGSPDHRAGHPVLHAAISSTGTRPAAAFSSTRRCAWKRSIFPTRRTSPVFPRPSCVPARPIAKRRSIASG